MKCLNGACNAMNGQGSEQQTFIYSSPCLATIFSTIWSFGVWYPDIQGPQAPVVAGVRWSLLTAKGAWQIFPAEAALWLLSSAVQSYYPITH